MAKPIVTVVGSFAVGMTIRSPQMPVWGETLRGGDFDMGPGGKRLKSSSGHGASGCGIVFCGHRR